MFLQKMQSNTINGCNRKLRRRTEDSFHDNTESYLVYVIRGWGEQRASHTKLALLPRHYYSYVEIYSYGEIFIANEMGAT